MTPEAQRAQPLLEAARRIATEVAAVHAADVDAKARFPTETVAALKAAGLLSAPVPGHLGGPGLNLRELGALCAAVAQGCGSSGMVLAMHYIQVACVTRHALGHEAFEQALRELVQQQQVWASITSEVGTFGDTRSSVCAVQRSDDGHFTLDKEATTGSYCAHADAYFVTCRRHSEAPAGDQVLVMVQSANAQLTQTTTWDTMGMRGTCSPGFSLRSQGPQSHILPVGFGEISAQTMVPYSHTLWAALWSGIASDAHAKAAGSVRAEARRTPGNVPLRARALAEASMQLQALRHNWHAVADQFDRLGDGPEGREALQGMDWALRFNHLKTTASEATPRIVHAALQIIGLPAYKNDSPLSLSRQYRDALSGALMVANDRITGKSAALLCVLKDD